MKKNIFSGLFIGVVLSLLISSCKETKLTDFYNDPEKTPNTQLEWMLTTMETGNVSFRASYWNHFAYLHEHFYSLTQTLGFDKTSKDRYLQQDLYVSARWERTYFTGTLAKYREMEFVYNELPAEKKEGYRVIMEAAKTLFIYETQKATDLFGDMPFSEAGKLRDKQNQIIFAKFDSQESIYTWCLDELKKSTDFFQTYNVASNGYYMGMFKKQDLLLNGNIDQWTRFANSLRLRMVMRIVEVSPDKAKPIIAEALQKPLVENNDQNIELKAKGPDLLVITNQGEKGIWGSWTYHSSVNFANGFMFSKMATVNGIDDITVFDPRVRVLFAKTSDGKYRGYDWSWDKATQEQLIQSEKISRIDTATITQNDFLPSSLITASEVDFLKAEAYNRGFSTGDAKTAYENGIKNSINYYYAIRNLSVYEKRNPLTVSLPDDAEINAFLALPQIAYASEAAGFEKIMMQKWIHLGFLQYEENFAELRRTDLPVLPADVDNSNIKFKQRSLRFLYPSREKQSNPVNYQPYVDKDLPDIKVWWDVKN